MVLAADPPPAANDAFNRYSREVDLRLDRQHRSTDGFLARAGFDARRQFIERLQTPEIPGALLRHWRGTAFAPGARASDFERLIGDIAGYPRYFAPQVDQARVLWQGDDEMRAWIRVRQRHVITVVMDTTYDIVSGRLDSRHGYSISRSTHIEDTGGEDRGFLWRLSTYWSYEEREHGLALQIESISLSRSIPRGLGWVVRPYVESVPRESLEFTLRAVCDALRA